MNAKKIIFHILRVLFGLIFILSGVIKLFPIEPFEVLVTDIGIASWALAPFLSRILISFEIILGLFIILNLYPKQIIKLSLITVLIFNLYLLYAIFFRKDINDCGCFGNLVNLTPWQSFIKNSIMLLWGYYLFRTSSSEIRRFKLLLSSLLVLVSLGFPLIINPPDAFFDYGLNNEETGERFDFNTFGDQQFNDGFHSVEKGKVVLAFFSLRCKFCRYAAMKLSIIHREQKEQIPLFFVFWDLSDNKALSEFHISTKSEKIPFRLMNVKEFLHVSGPSLPAIFFLEDGIIKKKTGFRTLKPEDVIEFLNLKKD